MRHGRIAPPLVQPSAWHRQGLFSCIVGKVENCMSSHAVTHAIVGRTAREPPGWMCTGPCRREFCRERKPTGGSFVGTGEGRPAGCRLGREGRGARDVKTAAGGRWRVGAAWIRRQRAAGGPAWSGSSGWASREGRHGLDLAGSHLAVGQGRGGTVGDR